MGDLLEELVLQFESKGKLVIELTFLEEGQSFFH